MRRPALISTPTPRALCAALLAAVSLLFTAPVGARAAVLNFGSPLSVAATEDTVQNLGYVGATGVTYGTGAIVHTAHDGADTALWNTQLPHHATAAAPQPGQITAVRLEGCAEPAAGGPAPLTQIHFQALTPAGGATVHVDVTSQPFDIPTCGVAGASDRTVTTYRPTNLCVNRGDIVDFNDEGGFDPTYYPSGVRYRVIGAASGATMSSFIADNGTNNGATLSATLKAATHGFASNPREELLLAATLATGVDATPLCPGGLHGLPGMPGGKPALAFGQAAAGVNHAGVLSIVVYCDLIGRPCAGRLSISGSGRVLADVALSAPTGQVSVTRVHLSPSVIAAIRKHGGLPVSVVAQLRDATSVTHAMQLRI